jgi:hypothetical protein
LGKEGENIPESFPAFAHGKNHVLHNGVERTFVKKATNTNAQQKI